MGQKVHPIGIRLGISKKWSSNWFSDSSNFSKNIHQDFLIRELLNKKLKDAINEVAAEGNYTYIFTSEILHYASESNDIGSLVRKKLKL